MVLERTTAALLWAACLTIAGISMVYHLAETRVTRRDERRSRKPTMPKQRADIIWEMVLPLNKPGWEARVGYAAYDRNNEHQWVWELRTTRRHYQGEEPTPFAAYRRLYRKGTRLRNRSSDLRPYFSRYLFYDAMSGYPNNSPEEMSEAVRRLVSMWGVTANDASTWYKERTGATDGCPSHQDLTSLLTANGWDPKRGSGRSFQRLKERHVRAAAREEKALP